jgi:hypothetical protein
LSVAGSASEEKGEMKYEVRDKLTIRRVASRARTHATGKSRTAAFVTSSHIGRGDTLVSDLHPSVMAALAA